MVSFYETYSFPEPIFNAYKTLKDKGFMNEGTSVELENFCSDYPQHELPRLIDISQYK